MCDTVLSDKQIQKRAAIVNAAIEVFAQYGFHEAKIAQIAAQANVGDGTIYLYFKNKEDLLIKVFEEIITKRLDQLQSLLDNEQTAMDKLVSFFNHHVALFSDQPFVARLMAVELRQSPEFLERYPTYQPLRRYLGFLETLINDAIAEGSIRPIDTKSLSFLIFGTMNFVITEWSLSHQTFSLNETKNTIADIVLHGLLPRS
ncbi:MAG: TetR family transcriptional regulator [Candidatus Cloacimonetes bacterium]|nr:TetR family transcriptional regulator [Candidatus Cloacimonadota bacterium]